MRPARALRVIALVILLALPGALGQGAQAWDELAGSGARTGAAFLPSATLDVLAYRDLLGNDTVLDLRYSKGLVATPHGLLALAERGETCVLLRVNGNDVVDERELDACDEGTLTAYDRAHDRLIVCSEGGPDESVLQARDAVTGALVWSVRPGDLEVVVSDPGLWRCTGTAIDRDRGVAYVAFFTAWGATVPGGPGTAAGATTVIARVQLADGIVDWDRPLGASAFQGGGGAGRTGGTGGFLPIGISVTDNGVVVSGRTPCACGKLDPVTGKASTQQGAVAWLAKDDGDLVGAALAEDDVGAVTGDAPGRFLGQWWASTQGPLAAFLIGERMLVVNPYERDPVREAPFGGIETGPGYIGIIPSAWWGKTIVVPVSRSVTTLDAVTLAPTWSWTAGDEWVVSALLMLPPNDVFVLVVNYGDDGNGDKEAMLHRLDLTTGDELQRIPLPHTIPMSGGTGRARFQPMADGTLLLYTMDGDLFTLGPADPAVVPRVRVSEAYPETGESVTLTVDAPREDVNYTITWGDGTLTEGGTTWTHRYGGEGTRTARVTAALPDNRTATAEVLIRVGATPPPELNALQRAFAPENQDLTFGLLGLALTAGGGGIALLARRRRHSRLRDDLLALERIREQGRADPEGAVLALGAYREKLFADLEAGRVDDAQYHTLDARADAAFSALRTRLLGPLAGRLTADFRHALDIVLHDGRVDEDEHAALAAALEGERHITEEERARIRALLTRLGRGSEARGKQSWRARKGPTGEDF